MDIGLGDDETPGRHRMPGCVKRDPATHTASSGDGGMGGTGGRSSVWRAKRAAAIPRPSWATSGRQQSLNRDGRDHTSARPRRLTSAHWRGARERRASRRSRLLAGSGKVGNSYLHSFTDVVGPHRQSAMYYPLSDGSSTHQHSDVPGKATKHTVVQSGPNQLVKDH